MSLSRTKAAKQGGLFHFHEAVNSIMEKVTNIEQYLNLLVYVIRADSIIDDQEIGQLQVLLRARCPEPLSDEELTRIAARLTAEGPAKATDDELVKAGFGIDDHTLMLLVRDAYSLASSDGEVDGSEIQTLRRFLRLHGIPVERFANIDLWARNPEADLETGVALLSPAKPAKG